MGYYTEYTLSFYIMQDNDNSSFIKIDDTNKLSINGLEDEIKKMNVFEFGDIQNGYYANTKWYLHEEDMTILSRKFPQILFHLHGEGDDREDMWDKYFYNGMTQECRAIITYDKFDYNKLVSSSLDYDEDADIYSYQE